MGAPMVRHLIAAAGHELRVWNRSEGKTEPLLREGALGGALCHPVQLGRRPLQRDFFVGEYLRRMFQCRECSLRAFSEIG